MCIISRHHNVVNLKLIDTNAYMLKLKVMFAKKLNKNRKLNAQKKPVSFRQYPYLSRPIHVLWLLHAKSLE